MRIPIVIICLFVFAKAAMAGNSSRNFGGVGIDGSPWADGRIVVKQLVAGGPAHLAGIKAGDIITHIDGKPTEGSDFKVMVERMRGRAGTPVEIVIRRSGESKRLKYTLIRRQIVIPPKP